MTHFVLLTDSDDGCALIACPDAETAEAVASAAVLNDGDVSAWLVPTQAITDTDRVIAQLSLGMSVNDLHEGTEWDPDGPIGAGVPLPDLNEPTFPAAEYAEVTMTIEDPA